MKRRSLTQPQRSLCAHTWGPLQVHVWDVLVVGYFKNNSPIFIPRLMFFGFAFGKKSHHRVYFVAAFKIFIIRVYIYTYIHTYRYNTICASLNSNFGLPGENVCT